MARPRQTGLTENELEVMTVLWSHYPLTVGEILERIHRRPKPAYTSLLTLIQAMEKKKYISYVKQGKAYAYSPKIEQKNFKTSELKRLLKRLFGGSSFSLVMNLIENEQLSDEELAQLRQVLDKK